MTFNIIPTGPIGSVIAEPVYSHSSVGASTTVTLGSQDSSRRILAFIGNAADGGSISAASIGGVTTTHIIGTSNGLNVAYCRVAHVPNGSTGTLAITGTSASYRVCLYAIYESGSTPFDFVASASDAVSVDAPARGVILAGRFHISGVGTSWFGLDKDFDAIAGGGQSLSTAHREFSTAETNHSVSASGGTLHSPIMIGVSFGP